MCKPDLNLDQLLSDPLVQMVMRSDFVEESDIRRLAKRAGAARWANRPTRPAANRPGVSLSQCAAL